MVVNASVIEINVVDFILLTAANKCNDKLYCFDVYIYFMSY